MMKEDTHAYKYTTNKKDAKNDVHAKKDQKKDVTKGTNARPCITYLGDVVQEVRVFIGLGGEGELELGRVVLMVLLDFVLDQADAEEEKGPVRERANELQ